MHNPVGDGCSAWKLFLDLEPDSRLLVLGCDPGNIANNLAANAGEVFALAFDTRRGQPAEDSCSLGRTDDSRTGEGITLVAGGDGAGLPFADNCMDCVVLSGVLERAGEGDLFQYPEGRRGGRITSGLCSPFGQRNPRVLQLNFLREIRRILKPQGQIFIGAENRFNYEHFRGGGENRSNQNFTALMPRAIANLYSLYKLGQPYRTYSHSLMGYKRLLAGAGFRQSDFLGLLTGKRFVEEIVPIDGKPTHWQAPQVDVWRERLKRSGFFVPAYGIIASAQARPRKSLQGNIVDAVAKALGSDAGELVTHKYEVTGKQKLVVHASSGKQRLLIKHTFDSQGTNSERNNYAILTYLYEHRPKLSGVPRPIISGESGQQVFFAETAVQGRSLKQAIHGEQRVEIVKAALAYLLKINPPETAEHAIIEGALFEETVGKRLARIVPLLKEPAQADQLLAFFQKHFLGKSVLLGVAHGDFSSSNILIDGIEVSGVFDWEAGSVRNIPALDGISLLISVHRAGGANLSLAECLAMLATRQWPDSVEFNLLMDLYASMGVDEDCHAGIVYLSWLNGMDLRLRYGMDKDPDAIETYIHNVVRGIELG